MCKAKTKIDWQNSTLDEALRESEWHFNVFLKENSYTCNIPLGPGHEYHYSEKCRINGKEAGSNLWKLLSHFARSLRYSVNRSIEHIDRKLNGDTDVEAVSKKLPIEFDFFKVGTKCRKQEKWEMRNKDGSRYYVVNWMKNLHVGLLRGAMRDALGACKKHVDNPSHFGYPDGKSYTRYLLMFMRFLTECDSAR